MQLTLTGAYPDTVNDPTQFNGFSTYGNSGSGTMTVVFAPGTTVIFTSPNTATINGTPVTFKCFKFPRYIYSL